MGDALRVIGRAFRLWWGEIYLLTLFNVAWLALQVPVFTGPPATAAMYTVARRVADGEIIGVRDALHGLRLMLGPAWKWGAVNLVVIGAVVFNFWAFGRASGLRWDALRLGWGIIATLWFAMNLFYWPFWLSQADRRLVTTLRNGLVLFIKAPLFGLTLLVVCAVLIAASVALTLPLAVGLMAWLALIGTLAVDTALKPAADDNDTGIEMELI